MIFRPFLVVTLALVAGCSTPESSEHAAVQAAASATSPASGGRSLYDIPEMRRARLARERGASELTRAYATKEISGREGAFQSAWNEFRSAEEGYHDALVVAPARFHPVIENEIAQVAHYMRQIQRDRAAPKD